MSKQITIFSIVLLITIILVIANGVGIPVRKEVGNYYIEFGIEPAPKIREKAIISFSVHLQNGTPIAIDDFFVRISKGDRILFATTDFAISKEGPMFVTYEFPEQGNYDIDISAIFNGDKIQASFPVQVSGRKYFLFIYIIIALLSGLIICYVLKTKKLL